MNPLTLLKYLRNPFVLAIALGVLVVISFMVDAKMNQRDRNQSDYFKLFGSVVATSLTTHFYLKSKPSSPHSQQGGGTYQAAPIQSQYTHEPVTNLYTDSDVFSGSPNF